MLGTESKKEDLAVNLAGYIEIEGNRYWCGVRVLTKEESQNNDGFCFKKEELEALLHLNDQLVPKEYRDRMPNIKTLAANLLSIQKQENFGLFFTRIGTTSFIEEGKSETEGDDDRQNQAIPVTETVFHPGDIVAYTQSLVQENPNLSIAMLNPANRTSLGGGAFLGANALEEIFFRCSNLAFAYIKHAWNTAGFSYAKNNNTKTARPNYTTKLQPGEAWYTPNITFTQKPGGNAGEYQPCKPFTVGVICSAAPIYDSVESARKDVNGETIIKKEIRAQLGVAITNGVKLPVLTAFGCGAFHNDPTLVGRYYADVLYEEGYANHFNAVHFAIWADPNPYMPDNEKPFREAFQARRDFISRVKIVKIALEERRPSRERNGQENPIVKAGDTILKEATLLYPTLSEEKDRADLLESLRLATAVIENPTEDAISALKNHALSVANGKPKTWKKICGALMVLAGIAIMASSMASVPFSGGASLQGVYIGSSLIAASGVYTLFRGYQPQGMSKELMGLASAAEKNQLTSA